LEVGRRKLGDRRQETEARRRKLEVRSLNMRSWKKRPFDKLRDLEVGRQKFS
jgi:hypothetical protein